VAFLLPQEVRPTGLSPAYSPATAGGDTFSPGVVVFLHVRNASGSTVTVTVPPTWQVAADVTASPQLVSIPNGQDRMIGAFPRPWYANPTTVTCAPSSGVTLAVCALGVLTPGSGVDSALLPSLTLYPALTLFPKA
jgi:hypothetical protein